MPKNKIPDRWLDYKPFGDVIEGTRLLPIKVPLKQALCEKLPPEKHFTPADMFEHLEDKNYKLGMLIDLTATTRYYDSQEITERGVQYVKIFTQGHVVPSPDVIRQFSSAVTQFEEENSNNDLIIGVHCTHGVNRTGYLICRYLIETKEMESEKVLKAFARARGYPVERENYIQSLQRVAAGEPDLIEEETRIHYPSIQNGLPRGAYNHHSIRRPWHQDQFQDWTRDYRGDNYPPQNAHQPFPFDPWGGVGQGYPEPSWRAQNGYCDMGSNWTSPAVYDDKRTWRTREPINGINGNWREHGPAHGGMKWNNRGGTGGQYEERTRWGHCPDYSRDRGRNNRWPRGGRGPRSFNHQS